MEVAKDNRVLYVNLPLNRKSAMETDSQPVQDRLAVVKGKKNALEQVEENLWVLQPDYISESINWLPKGLLFSWFNKINNRSYAECIQKAVMELGFENIIIFNDSLMFDGFHLKEYLAPSKYLYYVRDYLISQPYFKKHGTRFEADIMKKADAVVANSEYLKDYALQYNKAAFYVGQGCDFTDFDIDNVKENPYQFAKAERKRIGYVGTLTSMRLDIPLLERVATSFPQHDLVLVGPADEAFKNSKLNEYSNVYFTGAVNTTEVANHIYHLDICINPQVVNELTIGNYPRKIDEYLAMGRPVVAVKTNAMKYFETQVELADNHEQFIRLINTSLSEESDKRQAERRAYALGHSWENNVNEIYKVV